MTRAMQRILADFLLNLAAALDHAGDGIHQTIAAAEEDEAAQIAAEDLPKAPPRPQTFG